METYLEILGQTKDDLIAKLKEDAKKQLNQYFTLLEIGKRENLRVTSEELEFEVSKIADQYNMKVEDVKKALGDKINDLAQDVFMRKVEDYLFANNK